ncbi:MAG: hypothetical protein IPL69_20420 [Saprospiraceae bacterium]|nr:hypothetical protein [Candidatus Brachybacter algidus]
MSQFINTENLPEGFRMHPFILSDWTHLPVWNQSDEEHILASLFKVPVMMALHAG